MDEILKKRQAEKGSYMYRPKRVYPNGHPLHKRFITRIEKLNKFLFLRLLGKILRVHPLNRKLEVSEISSVLFIRYDAFGDMVVTTPLWRILKRIKPSIIIGVAGSRKNLSILEADTDVDVIYDYSASSLKDFRKITAKTRNQKWDLVVMCKFNQKTRGGIISRLSTKDGYNVTIGTKNAEGHQALFSRLIPLPRSEHGMQMTEQLQHLLHSVIDLPKENIERPSVMIDPQHEKEAKDKISTILSNDSCSKYIVINTDAPEVRKWSIENNISLGKFIENEYKDYSVFFTSLPENKDLVEKEISSANLMRSYYFPTDNIQYLFTLIRYSSLVVTPDTGIAHLASAENKPILGFYPQANEWLPFDIPSYIIIPKNNELISSIPLEFAAHNLKILISELQANKFSGTHIVYCENQKKLEVRI